MDQIDWSSWVIWTEIAGNEKFYPPVINEYWQKVPLRSVFSADVKYDIFHILNLKNFEIILLQYISQILNPLYITKEKYYTASYTA